MESIQQKVELSQQLDQWQADMEELLEDQMVKKMRAQEASKRTGATGDTGAGAGDSDSSQTESRTSKILSFFGRTGDLLKNKTGGGS